MIINWLKTALLAYLAVILIQCNPTDATPAPAYSLTPVTNDVHGPDLQTASTTPGQSNAIPATQIPPTPSPMAGSRKQNLVETAREDLAQGPLVTGTAAFDNYPTLIPGAVIGTPGPEEQNMIVLAKDQLTRKLNVSLEEISLFSALAMGWPDTSLGCPLSGKTYADIVTPGYQIWLEWDKSIYTFHTDTQDRVILCHIQPPHEIYHEP